MNKIIYKLNKIENLNFKKSLIKVITYSFLSSALLLNAASFAGNMQPAPAPVAAQDQSPATAPAQDQAAPTIKPGSADADSPTNKRKQFLDEIRKGVVVITVKSKVLGSTASWTGTGFIVDEKNGFIVTNRHVAGQGVNSYELKFHNGTTTKATVKYVDPLLDIAFLKFDVKKMPKDCKSLKLAEKGPEVNETIYAMGNASNDEFSTIKGSVFNKYETIGSFSDQSFRFSGLTFPGASGSPVCNEKGEVVGLLYAGKFISGVAMPVTYLRDLLQQLQSKKIPQRYYPGATFNYGSLSNHLDSGAITKNDFDQYNQSFPDANNKIVVVKNTSTSKENPPELMSGDVVWKVGGELIGPNLYRLQRIINESGGNKIEVEVLRDGKLEKANIKSENLLSNKPSKIIRFADACWAESDYSVKITSDDHEPGVFMMPLSPQSRHPFSTLYTEYSSYSNPYLKILEIDGVKIKTLDDVIIAIKKVKDKEVFSVKFMDLMGDINFDIVMSFNSRCVRKGLVKHETKNDFVVVYTLNNETGEWSNEVINLNSNEKGK